MIFGSLVEGLLTRTGCQNTEVWEVKNAESGCKQAAPKHRKRPGNFGRVAGRKATKAQGGNRRALP